MHICIYILRHTLKDMTSPDQFNLWLCVCVYAIPYRWEIMTRHADQDRHLAYNLGTLLRLIVG